LTAAYGAVELPPVVPDKPVTVRVAKARNLIVSDMSGSSDPYVSITVVGRKLEKEIKSEVVKKVSNYLPLIPFF
jgi:Ca2+-dependent lipid-binding protein